MTPRSRTSLGALCARIGAWRRWNDTVFAIDWPVEIEVINERDRSYPDFVPEHVSA